MQLKCSDICEIVHTKLNELGFKIDIDNEDHTDMMKALEKVRFLKIEEDDEYQISYREKIKNKSIEEEKELDSKILEFLESRKLTKTSAYSVWDIFEEIYNMKMESLNYIPMQLVKVGCAVSRLYECDKIMEINIKDDDVMYYMAK